MSREVVRWQEILGGVLARMEARLDFAEEEVGALDVESVLEELAVLLRGAARELYPQFIDRLAKVEQMTDGIGWGFHDFVADIVGLLEEELGGR